jgi:hypothetical protein
MSATLAGRWQRLLCAAGIERRLIAVALIRIGFGALLCVYYTVHAFQREFVWGPRGVLSTPMIDAVVKLDHAYTLYALSDSELVFNLLYACGFLISVAFLLGWKSRVTSVLFFIFTWSLYQRNYFAIDGGDNVIFLISFFLMFADVGRRFSLDARAEARAGCPVAIPWWRAMLHNYAVLACLVQICILYLFSGLWKANSHMWLNGTAIYYILRVNEFQLPGISPLIYRSAALGVLSCYATIIFEMLLPFDVWKRSMRIWMLLGAIVLHLSIGIVMGLMYFSLAIIVADLIFLADDQYVHYGRLVRSWVTGVRGVFTGPARVVEAR